MVNVQQQGDEQIDDNSQVILFQMKCSGRITGYMVSLSQEENGSNYPSIQVWSPTESAKVLENVNNYMLTEDDINETQNYYFANVTFAEDKMIKFNSSSYIGYYQPSDSRYTIWSVNTTAAGYSIFTIERNEFNDFFDFVEATGITDSQPLIQIVIGIFKCTIAIL